MGVRERRKREIAEREDLFLDAAFDLIRQDGLLNLFSAETTGKDFVLEPATDIDMRGKFAAEKPSLEVVYDNA